ncbi:MAG: hypothetical protein JNL79_18010 [Myxococcales bacterium]|nr:hypothetical protein [Myxococcales bacterium]
MSGLFAENGPWLLVAVLVVGLILGLWFARLGRSSRSKGRNRVAAEGERDAEVLLEDAGYQIVDRQVRRRFSFAVDGAATEVEVRADLLVERRGRTLVAEVKTGSNAPDPTYPPTRRQLLEYSLVFGADEVLLVDVPAGEIHVISFAMETR